MGLFEVDVGEVVVELVVYVSDEGACWFGQESGRGLHVKYDGSVQVLAGWWGRSQDSGAKMDCGFPEG